MGQERNVLLVGRIGLPDVKAVFRSLAKSVGSRALRFPDGECGARSSWIMWQLPIIAGSDFFEVAETIEIQFGGSVRKFDKYKLVDGVDPASVRFGSLGYAQEAIKSYEIFQELRNAGEIPAGTRFQISLPTPVAVSTQHFIKESQGDVEPAYERAMKNEIDIIADRIPLDDLAIQWDVCQEVLAAAGGWDIFYDGPVGDALERLVRLASYVPEPCELGIHLCYGDPGHKHIKEPDDLNVCITFVNGICSGSPRPVNWVHMPVPKDRDDDAFFGTLGPAQSAANY